MIEIILDSPVSMNGMTYKNLYIDTPIRAGHFLRAARSNHHPTIQVELIFESILGVPRGFLEQLSLEDYSKVQEAICPFLASFQRIEPGPSR